MRANKKYTMYADGAIVYETNDYADVIREMARRSSEDFRRSETHNYTIKVNLDYDYRGGNP